jgi:glycosyltransferase involved in cell wall biosynthesis
MKVLHVITGLNAGGAELQLAMLLSRTRHDADVVTLYNPGPVAEQIRDSGTGVRNLNMTKNTELSAMLRLQSIMRRGRYDVVHTHLYRSQVYAHPAARLARTPVVVTTEHSIGETHIERRKMSSPVRALYLASERLSDATIAVSGVVRERLVHWGVPAGKITVIPNAVETSALRFDPAARSRVRDLFGIGEDTFVIGTLGRLDPNKRVDLAIEAAAPMLSDRCKILVIGRGEDEDRLRGAAASLGVTSQVIFGGYQADTAAMLAAFDLYVATSVQETFGLSVLEAIASGLPVLYTVCPALDGMQTDRARQVPGSVPELRHEIHAQMQRPAGPRDAPASIFEFYGADSVVGRIDDLYEQVLAVHPRRARRSPAPAATTRRGSLSPDRAPAAATLPQGSASAAPAPARPRYPAAPPPADLRLSQPLELADSARRDAERDEIV